MSMRYKGAVLSATAPTTSSSSAQGIWTMRQQLQAVGGTGWPVPPANFIGLLYSTLSTESAKGLTVDSLGNIIFCGSYDTYGTIVAKYNSAGVLQWQQYVVYTSSDAFYGVSVDSSNNIYVVGASIITGVRAMTITVLNSSGTLLWKNKVEGSQSGFGYSVAVDSVNNTYITGQILSGFNTAQTVKFNSSGVIQWQTKLSNTSYHANGFCIALDGSNNVYIAGASLISGSGYWSGLVAKYNTSGTLQWQKILSYGVPKNTFLYGCTVDASGNMYVCGYSSGGGATDTIIAKYNSSGVVQWQRSLSNSDAVRALKIALDSSNNVYICGEATTFPMESFVVKYNSSGVIQWQRKLSNNTASSNDSFADIKISSAGLIYVCGYSNPNSTPEILFASLPSDGSKTGVYSVGIYTFTYASSTFTESSASYTAADSTLTSAATGYSSPVNTLSIGNSTLTSSVTTI